MTALAARRPHHRGSRFWDVETFLEFYATRPDEERWQLVDGLSMMVAPPTFTHQRIVGNIGALLENAVAARSTEVVFRFLVCVPGQADFCAAPDLIVAADEPSHSYFAESFVLAAEVSSQFDSHELIDRKLELYRSHPDNLYSLTVDQDSVHVTLYARESGWTKQDFRSLTDVVELPAFRFRATLAEIYAGTPLAR
jgi:Uma2 family endonuclease